MPLGEDLERYEVDVLDGSAAVRTLACSQPNVLYSAANEAADFGGAQASLDLRLSQMSSSVGRGFVCAVTVPVL